MVILLLLSMIAGVIAVVWLLVTRLPVLLDRDGPQLPPHLAMPAGETATAVTLTRDRVLVVTAGGRLLVFGEDGALQREIMLEAP